jgi:uncharacterized membrane protein
MSLPVWFWKFSIYAVFCPILLSGNLMAAALLVLFYVFAPLGILYFCHIYRWANRLGPVIIAYIIGLILGNSGLLPFIESAPEVQDLLTTLTIPIAIPLLLFAIDIKKWLSIAGKTFVSMLIAFTGVVSMVVLGYFLLSGSGITDLWKVSGLLVGVYTGGTPNLASIKLALDVDETMYVVTHTYDLLIGAFYLLFMLSVAQRFFLWFLPSYKFIDPLTGGRGNFAGEESYSGINKRHVYLPLLKALALAVNIFIVSGAAGFFMPSGLQMTVVILLITTLGILASLWKWVNRIEKTFELGMYFILIFSLVVASMADLRQFITASPAILFYVTLAVFGSLLVQVILSRIFRIDADTLMITSTAFICSPLFVPVVAGALRNREVIVSGLTVGIIGYAVGNYLGVMIAYLLRGF